MELSPSSISNGAGARLQSQGNPFAGHTQPRTSQPTESEKRWLLSRNSIAVGAASILRFPLELLKKKKKKSPETRFVLSRSQKVIQSSHPVSCRFALMKAVGLVRSRQHHLHNTCTGSDKLGKLGLRCS